MFTEERVKSGFHAWYMLCPVRHTLLLLSLALILLHLLTRPIRALNVWLSAVAVRPAHLWLSGLTGQVPWSVAELLIALLVFALGYYLVSQLINFVRKPAFSCASTAPSLPW